MLGSDILDVAIEVSEQILALGHEDHGDPLQPRVPGERGQGATLAHPCLVAFGKTQSAFEALDAKQHRIGLFGGECLRKVFGVIIERARQPGIDILDAFFRREHRAACMRRQISRNHE